MMITNKVKAILALNGFSFKEYADKLGITKQSLNNKAKAEAYKGTDLIKLAELTNTTLAFIDKNGEPIIKFDLSDIE